MFRKCALFAVLVLFATSALAQNDSLNFVKAKWETKKVAKGVKWKHHHFKGDLFAVSQNIDIVEIDPRSVNIALGAEKKILKLTPEFTHSNTLAAINGGFFYIKNGGAVDYIRINDTVMSENRGTGRVEHQQGAVVIYKGQAHIARWDGSKDWERYLYGDVMTAGPVMVYNNNVIKLDSTSFVKTRHPRTAVAVTRDKVLVITIDGRHENSAGMSLFELAKVIKWLKATDGINLDGGGSTTMWLKSDGVVNYPTDNKKWDHEGLRKVANVILVNKRK